MGGLTGEAQGKIKIKVRKQEHTGDLVHRESRVKVDANAPGPGIGIWLGVKLIRGQTIEKLILARQQIHLLPRDAQVQGSLIRAFPPGRYGEWWGYHVPHNQVPLIPGFDTTFDVSPGQEDDQVVDWKAVIDTEDFETGHVIEGQATIPA